MSDITVSADIHAFLQCANKAAAATALEVAPSAALAVLNARGSDIASASTVSFTAAGTQGSIHDITGTTTITAITLADGRRVEARFTGILTLTHGASLILPTAANITTAAGDVAIFRGYGSGVVRCIGYTRAAGTALAGGSTASDTTAGVVELATPVEAAARAASNLAVTPEGLGAALDANGAGLLASRAYAFSTSGSFTSHTTANAALKACHAAGGGGVYTTPGAILFDEQIQMFPDVKLYLEGGIEYTGLGPVILEPPKPLWGIFKIEGGALIKKTVANATTNSAAASASVTAAYSSGIITLTKTSGDFSAWGAYSYVTFSGFTNSGTDDLNAGVWLVEKLTTTTMRVYATVSSISGTGTMTRQVSEHVHRVTTHQNHLDVRSYNIAMSVNSAQTNSSNFSIFKIKGGIVHTVGVHGIDGANCSTVHHITGKPDIIADRIKSTGSGISTIVCDGDGTASQSGVDNISRLWTSGKHLEADPGECAIKYKGNDLTRITYHFHDTVEGRIEGKSWTGDNTSILIAVLGIGLQVSRYEQQVVPTSDPMVDFDGTTASSIELVGSIGALKVSGGIAARLKNITHRRGFILNQVDAAPESETTVILTATETPFQIAIGSIMREDNDKPALQVDGPVLVTPYGPGTIYGQVAVSNTPFLKDLTILSKGESSIIPIGATSGVHLMGNNRGWTDVGDGITKSGEDFNVDSTLEILDPDGEVEMGTRPANTVAPSPSTVSAIVGGAITANPGTWSNADTHSYRWFRGDGSPVSAWSSDATYTPGEEDIGSSLYFLDEANGAGGTAIAQSTSTNPVEAE
jgi:hypothetical protein